MICPVITIAGQFVFIGMEQKHIELNPREIARREALKNAVWCSLDTKCPQCGYTGPDPQCIADMHFDFFTKEDWEFYALLMIRKP